jgi:hypothetical protein
MNLREWMNNNAAVITIGAVVLVVVAIVVAYYSVGGSNTGGIAGGTTKQAWFYDLNTGQKFAAPLNSRAPIEAPSGPHNGKPGGVRAYVFSCTDCDEESFIGWLETWAEQNGMVTNLVRTEQSDKWISAESKAGMDLTMKARTRCPEGQTLKSCYPE